MNSTISWRLLAVAPLALLATACGSGSATPDVASLPDSSVTNVQQTPAPPTPPASDGTTDTSGVPDGVRPIFRLDDTDERRTALINA